MSDILHIEPTRHDTPLCVVCERAPGTVERPDGEWECLDCATLRADRDYERLRDHPELLDDSKGESHG